jgi:hypothetical protein
MVENKNITNLWCGEIEKTMREISEIPLQDRDIRHATCGFQRFLLIARVLSLEIDFGL